VSAWQGPVCPSRDVIVGKTQAARLAREPPSLIATSNSSSPDAVEQFEAGKEAGQLL